MSAVEDQIRDFLLNELLTANGVRSLGPDDSLFKSGLIDSMVALKIVAFCEENFGIKIPDLEVKPDNFKSIRALARMVEKLKGQSR
jgi:D-alanine--poly(phosphoribitol) ligase subunit 2